LIVSAPVCEKENFGRLRIWLAGNWPVALVILVALSSSCIAIVYAGEPLLEIFPLRQTQTGITAYWMIHGGLKLAYETPTMGYPWSVPYEFPLYQSLVALISWAANFPLDNTGRLLSFCFLIACAWPAFAVSRRLNLPPQTAWIFCALFWSSSLYMFYSRTFLMETTALFFTLAAVPYALDLRNLRVQKSAIFLFIFFATLGLLQKVTTAAPVMMVMGFTVLGTQARTSSVTLRSILRLVLIFSVPFLVEILWVRYTDDVKSRNAYGSELTSASMHEWVFGTLVQRMNPNLLKAIFWNRLICRDTMGPLGLLPLAGALIGAERRVRIILFANLALFLLPVLIFINLQWRHDYYQTECAVFLISAISIAISAWLPKFGFPLLVPSITILFVIFNFFIFYHTYSRYLSKSLNSANTDVLAISDVVRRYTPSDSAIAVYGLDLTSSIPYYAQRKALVAAKDEYKESRKTQYKSYLSAWREPERYLGGLRLGAIVFCPSDELTLDRMLEHPDVKRHPSLFKVGSCYINLPGLKSIVTDNGSRVVLPGIPFDPLLAALPKRYANTVRADCLDNIDVVNDKLPGIADEHSPHARIGVPGLLLIEGRLARSEGDGIVPDDAFITFKSPTGVMKYVAIKPLPRTAAYSSILESTAVYYDLFSATPDIHSLKGNYSLGLARGYGDTLRLCNGNSVPLTIGPTAVR
jgi:hypothetical protein